MVSALENCLGHWNMFILNLKTKVYTVKFMFLQYYQTLNKVSGVWSKKGDFGSLTQLKRCENIVF